MHEMTKENLKEAFAGESMAHMKYLIFSEKAEKEGFPEIARLFKAIAYAEKVHAANHLKALGGIGKTVENLQTGIDGESYENTEMYPAFHEVAKLQEEKKAVRAIHYALEAERIHEKMYGEAKSKVEDGEDIAAGNVYVCPVCGHTVIGEAPKNCPVCNVPKDKYQAF